MTDRPLYRYAANFVRVIDGDTVVLDIDLGFKQWMKDQHVRLSGINTPELHGPDTVGAKKAKAFVEGWFQDPGMVFYVQSDKYDERGKYGRILATIFRGMEPGSLNEALLKAGLAVNYEGG